MEQCQSTVESAEFAEFGAAFAVVTVKRVLRLN